MLGYAVRQHVIASGTLLGPYEILSTLGSGGMGVVYRARDTRLGREVAIKVLPTEVTGDEERLHRFEKEARAVCALNHPNILDVHDIGTHQGVPFIVSELLEGETLRRRLSRGAVPISRALELARQIATGLAAAHDKGIVHRDLKPENVFVTEDGRIKILDFGLAKVTKPEAVSSSESLTETVDTQAGTVLGTVAYMSPEQIRGLPADRRSDIFSLGVVLYELLLGSRPFNGETPVETMTAILTKHPFEAAPESGRALPPLLERIVRHCLEKKPEERFQSARDVLFALDIFSNLPAVPAGVRLKPKPRMLAAALAGVILTLVTLYGAAVVMGRRSASSLPPGPYVQLTSRRGIVHTARFAPDGQTVFYGGAWEGRPFELFRSRTDGPESSSLVSGADILSVSHSGELAVLLGRRYTSGWGSSGTLARMLPAAGAPREILEGVQEADWARRDGELVITRRVEGLQRLEWPIGNVIHSTAGWISCPRVSPNGDAVAFFEHPVYADDRGAVTLIDKRGTKRVLSDGWVTLQGLAWSPSGNEIWFAGSVGVGGGIFRQLHAVDMRGNVRSLLKAPGTLVLHDVAPDGRVLLARDGFRSIVTGLAPGDRVERELGWTDFSIGQDLSDDGRTVLLSEQGAGTAALYDTYVRGTDGSVPTRLGEGLALALSPDGRWVMTLVGTSPPELVILPTRAGNTRRLPRGRIEQYSYAGSWFPDGKSILFQAHEAGKRDRLYIQSVDGGEPVALTPEGVHLRLQDDLHDPISPDGLKIALMSQDGRAWLYYRDGRAPTLIPGFAAGEAPLLWSRDGHFLITLQPLGAASLRVQRLDLNTHRKTLIRDVAPEIPGLMNILLFKAANDGETYVYTYWQRLSELYVVGGIK